MQKEFAVSLQKNDNGRVFLNGVLTENGIQSDAFFTFSYRAIEGLDVTQSVIVHVNIFKKSDIKEDTGNVETFEQLVNENWLKCEPLDFESWFGSKLEFDWNFVENEKFPYDAVLENSELVLDKNSKLKKAWESRKEALILKEKIASFLKLTSFSAEAHQELKELAKDSLKNEIIIKKHAEELKRDIDSAFEHLNSLRAEEEKKNCDEISPLVDEALVFAKEGENFKDIFSKLQDVQEKIKSVVIDEDIRFMFKNVMNEAFSVLKERQKKYFESMGEIREENFDKMSQLVEECIDAAKNYDKFKDAWKLLKSTNEKFNGLKMERDKYHILKDKMGEAFEILKKREKVYFDEMEQEWKSNYSKLSEHVTTVLSKLDDEIKQNEIWEELKNLQNELKTANIKREDQNELWDKIKGAFETVKEKRDAFKAEFNKVSKEKYKDLMKEAEEALNTAYFNKSFNEAFNIIKELQKKIFEEKYLTKEKREALKEKISRAFEVLKNRRERYYAEKDASNGEKSSEE